MLYEVITRRLPSLIAVVLLCACTVPADSRDVPAAGGDVPATPNVVIIFVDDLPDVGSAMVTVYPSEELRETFEEEDSGFV